MADFCKSASSVMMILCLYFCRKQGLTRWLDPSPFLCMIITYANTVKSTTSMGEAKTPDLAWCNAHLTRTTEGFSRFSWR